MEHTRENIIKSLRACSSPSESACTRCLYGDFEEGCRDQLRLAAAAMLEEIGKGGHDMDAVRYIVEYDRMCRSFPNCRDCPIRARVSFGSCEQFGVNNPEETVAIVEKWSAEHPKKTRLQDFLEKHPNALLGTDGFPWVRPVNMGYCNRRNCVGCDMQYSETTKLCWSLPLEE